MPTSRVTSGPAPTDALAQFLALAAALHATRPWFEDWTMLRHAAVTIPLMQAEATEIARRFRAAVADLKASTSWWRQTSASLRYFVAAALVRGEQTAAEFHQQFAQARAHFREAKLPRGSSEELLAFLILRESAKEHRVAAASIARMAELYFEVRKDHRWLLGTGEYPTIALLSTTALPATTIAQRVEALLARLTSKGFRRGRVMPISQLLFFAPEPDTVVCARFEALWNEFKAQGVKMVPDDYDEVGLLAFVPHPAAEVAGVVLEHRQAIRALRPKPDRSASFSLASSTAALQLLANDLSVRRLVHTAAALQVRSVIMARMVAAASA